MNLLCKIFGHKTYVYRHQVNSTTPRIVYSNEEYKEIIFYQQRSSLKCKRCNAILETYIQDITIFVERTLFKDWEK